MSENQIEATDDQAPDQKRVHVVLFWAGLFFLLYPGYMLAVLLGWLPAPILPEVPVDAPPPPGLVFVRPGQQPPMMFWVICTLPLLALAVYCLFQAWRERGKQSVQA